MRKLLALGAAASLLATAACGGSRAPAGPPPPPFHRPVVALRDVRMAGLGITGGSVDVVLNVWNPNDYGLQSPRVEYDIYAGNVRLGSGVHDSDLYVESGDSVLVAFPVKFTYLSIGRAGRQLLDMGTVDYRVLGDITVGTPYGRYTFPYDRNGRFASLMAVKLPR